MRWCAPSVIRLAAGVLLLSQLSTASADAPALFQDLKSAPAAAKALRPTAKMKQSRLTGMDVGRLLRQSTDEESTFRLSLFPGVDYDAVVDSTVMKGRNKFISRGHLVWARNSSFLFSVDGESVTGAVTIGPRRFMISTVPGGSGDATAYQLSEVDFQKFPACGCQPDQKVAAAPKAKLQPIAEDVTAGDDGSIIDVMIVYTPLARVAAGGTANMNAWIDFAIEDSNDSYLLSGVNQRLRLVHRAEVNYDESTGYSDALTALTSPFDGVMDEVHTLRNQYNADLVSMLITHPEACGLAWVMRTEDVSFEDRAFSVVDWSCITNFSLTHEMGHNMGLVHDVDNSSFPGVFPYSYGHRWTGNSGTEWRSIMAYAPGIRIGQHSNPNVLYDGIPTGVADAQDAVRSLNATAWTVSNSRQSSATPPSITSPLTASGEVGVQFNYQIEADSNVNFYSATGLPPGVYVNNTSGYIGGIPTAAGTYNVMIAVTNLFGTDVETLVITIEGEENPCLAQSLIGFGRSLGLVQKLGNDGHVNKLLQELYAVRDRVLNKSETGRQLIKDYYAHSAEATRIILASPELRQETISLMLALQPAFRAGVEQNGRFDISSVQWEQVQSVLTRIEQDASQELRVAVRNLRSLLTKHHHESDGRIQIAFP